MLRLSIVLLVISALSASATSIIFSVEEKLRHCDSIALVKITEIVSPRPRKSFYEDKAVVTARVLECFKGHAKKKITFQFHPDGTLPVGQLQKLVGQKFIVFLHTPNTEERDFYLFEGTKGMRPIQSTYSEYTESPDGKLTEATYTKAQYFSILRAITK